MSNVSVAMAVYNGELYLKEQLDSILEQLLPDDEIVISYDKSSDTTWEIISAFAKNDRRVKIYVNDNPCVFGNFENAIQHCSGDYIFISDQDDIWDRCKRNEVLKSFEEKKADMVVHNWVHINSGGKVISQLFFSMYKIGPNKVKNFVMPGYSGCCTAFHSSLTNLILPIPRNVGAYDHWIGSIGELLGHIYFLDKVLIYHRMHGNNITPKSRRKLIVVAKSRLNLAKELLRRKNRRK